MRLFIRHPTDVPIEIQDAPEHGYVQQATQDIGFGGLAFVSTKAFEPEHLIALRIPCLRPAFEVAMARVTWCHRNNGHFAIGVEFLDSAEAFRVRMVEQICHIESYQREVEQREGRHLTAEQAAEEWISRHASSFPDP
ncbi:PilZ domain-containing protein [Pseudomonas sp. SJZ079]|uniref:PilZ domain-containing protein n=1 Tax=Pseudomonas sp. SJZ079 TaxID=2572887 RepID=UPI001199C6A6|nr:PilZ domain-containing protein [Pseudomonas sp. SJZ079]TWC32794.1 PilZ domain-containing protein [Pseudomonas sp. SJZ079]